MGKSCSRVTKFRFRDVLQNTDQGYLRGKLLEAYRFSNQSVGLYMYPLDSLLHGNRADVRYSFSARLLLTQVK